MLTWEREVCQQLGQMWEHVKHLSFQQLMLNIQIADTAVVILLDCRICFADCRVCSATGCLCFMEDTELMLTYQPLSS